MLEISLSSGATLQVSHVELFNEVQVAAIASLTSQVAAKLGGASSGIGFIGSPGWVAGGIVALGLLEHLAAKQNAKDVAKVVEQIGVKTIALRNEGRYFEIEKVRSSDPANPQTWWAIADEPVLLEVNTAGWAWPDKKAFMEKYTISLAQQYDQTLRTMIEAARFVHDGSGFVRLKAGGRVLGVRWSEVISYCALSEG
jgi:hypothetical protein